MKIPYKRKRRRRRKLKKVILNKDLLKSWAILVKKRDKFSCKNCGSRGYLHSHHLVSKTYLPKNAFEVWNGITLCVSCHLGYYGVHGSHKPKSPFIEILRNIYKTKDIVAAKDISVHIPVNPVPCKPTSTKTGRIKKYKKYRRKKIFKRKFY